MYIYYGYGIVFALALIMTARLKQWDFLQLTIFLPAIYVCFAIFSSTPTQSVVEEMFFGMPILTLVAVSHMQNWQQDLRNKVAAAVWLFHGGYDYVHHWLVINDGVPYWYAPFCLSVDIVIGGYLIGLVAKWISPPSLNSLG